jgi:hypothetical protein
MEYRQRRPANNQQGKKRRVFTPTGEGEPASQQYAGHYAGIHPEDSPHLITADVRSHLPAPHTRPPQEPEDYEAGSFIATMSKRYNAIPTQDGVMFRQGNDQVYVHRGAPPQRAHRGQAQLPPPRQTDEVAVPVKKKQRRFRIHPLFFIGLGLLTMIIGFVLFNAIGAWWHTHNDDTTYGRPRTFQIDVVVGHGDSAKHPSHFIAINLSRHIVIIEIPGGDPSRSVIYSGGLLVGDGQDLAPVTLSFVDTHNTGKLDMVIHVGDQTIVFTNNGTKFVPPSNVVNGGSNPPSQGE